MHSEYPLMNQLDYNLFACWFVVSTTDESVWDPSTFSDNRDRLVTADIGRDLLDSVLGLAKPRRPSSNEHLGVDGALIAAQASQNSMRRGLR